MTTAPIDLPTYQRARAEGQRARDAYRLAQWIAKPKLDIGMPGERSESIERDGFTITFRTEYDSAPLDDDVHGHFEDGVEDWRTGYYHPETPGAIPAPSRDSRGPGEGARFYVPAVSREERVDWHRKAGASRSVALDMARADELREFEDAWGDGYGPTVVGLIVTARKEGIELGDASVWGIEIGYSKVTRTDGSEYLTEVAEDLIPEAIAEAREALERLVTA